MPKKAKSKDYRRKRVYYVLAAAAVAALLLWRLGNLTPGISQREMLVGFHNYSLGQVLSSPAFLPLHFLRCAALWLPLDPTIALRLPSVLLAFITLAAVVYILRRWYGPRTALFGFIIFVTSAWFLHVGRLASPDIAYLFALPALLAAHSMLFDHADKRWAFYLWLTIQLGLLYIPGMIWLVLLNAVWQRSELQESWSAGKRPPFQAAYMLALIVVILAPLVYSLRLGFNSSVILTLGGLPGSMPQWQTILANLKAALLFIAIRGQAPADIWLNHLPVLDAFLSGMLLIGMYFYAQHIKAARTRMLIVFGLLSLLLISVGGPVHYSLVVPLLYLVAAAGIAYFLHLWLKVFPRNPLARGVGIAMLALAIIMSSVYGLRQYFVAWPHHQATKAALHYKTPPSAEL